MRVRNRTGVGLVRSAFRRSGLVLPLFVLVFISAMMVGNPARVEAQTPGSTCRVGIAVDRSSSVAVRNPENPWIIKDHLNRLVRNDMVGNSNVQFSFWSFGTGVSGYDGLTADGLNLNGMYDPNPSGTQLLIDYPFYQFGSTSWINGSGASAAEKDRWRQRIYSIPFYVNADVFRRPSFVDPNNYPNWAANYTGGGPTSPSLSPFVHQSPANTLTFPHNSNLVISPNHSNSALPPWGTYTNENISSTAVVHYNTSRGGGTNWEAGLGKNNSGYLVGRSPNSELQRAAESDIIVLFTDAITDPENSSSWYANPANPEPNLPSGGTVGWPSGVNPADYDGNRALAWAHQAANHWKSTGQDKTIVIVKYDNDTSSNNAYSLIASEGDNTIIPLSGDNPSGGLTNLSSILADIANEKCSARQPKPYLKVFGNDARAGASFATQALCAPSDTARAANVLTYSETSGINRKGASVQHAVSATGNINDFYSAGRRQGIAQFPNGPKDLTFGNFEGGALPYNDSRMGYSGMSRCIPDYFAIATNNGTNKNVGVSSTGTVHNLSGFTLGNGARRVDLFDSKHVHISSNIQYQNDSWSNISNIPSYALIVKGKDIYIDDQVERLDGLYIALPDENGNGGRIFTCSTSGVVIPSANSSMASICNRKLKINGAFIARQVRFHRTNGNINNTVAPNEGPDSGNIAEVFDFSPEIYLGMPPALRRDSSSGRYDSIQSLPPIL